MIIRLDTPAAVAGAYEFADGSDVLTDAQVGDVVTADVWRGKAGSAPVATADSPSVSPVVPTAAAPVAAAFAVACLALGAWVIRWGRRERRGGAPTED